MSIKLTQRAVASLPPPQPDAKSSTAEYRDTVAKGLVVAVSKACNRSYGFRSSFRQKKLFIAIGDCNVISLDEAREMARQYRADIQRGFDPRMHRKKLNAIPYFKDFSDHYMGWARDFKRSHDDDQSKLNNHLLAEFGPYLLSDITAQMVHDYLGKKSSTLSPSTLNRHLSLLSRMFRLAIQWDLIDKNPCQGIEKFKELTQKTEFLSIEESKMLINVLECSPHRTAALACLALLYSGLRLEEVLQARQENLDLVNGVLYLPITKSGRSRNVVLNDLAKTVLAEAAAGSVNSPWVFAGRDPSKPIRNIRKTFRKALADAGLRMIRIHDLRHTHASLLVQQGVPLVQVQALLNHASPQTTMRYAHLADHTLRQATQVLANQLAK